MQQLMQKTIHYMQNGQYVEALKLCDDILASGNNHPQIHMMKAISLGHTNQIQESINIFNNLILHFPQNPEIFYNCGLVLQMNKNYNDAIDKYKSCLNINPNHYSAWNNLGIICRVQNHHNQALNAFLNCNRLKPNSLEYTRNLANQYYITNQYSHCNRILEPVFKSSNLAIEEDYIIGIDSLYKAREMIQAQHLYKKALKLFSNCAELFNLAGLIESDNKKYKLSKKYYQNAVELNKSNLEYKINLLTARSHLETSSKNIIKDVLSLLQKHSNDILAYEFAGALLESLNKPKKLNSVLKQGLKINPENPKLLYLKAKYKSNTKKFKKALSLLNQAERNLDMSKLLIDITYERARILDKQQKYKKSWKYLIKANQLNKKHINHPSPEQSYIEQTNTLTDDFIENNQFLYKKPKWNSNPKLTFIIGFPRSGTTLIERILAAHPKIQILEETNAINNIYLELNKLPGTSIFKKLYSLTTEQVQQLQNLYLSSIDEYIDWKEDNSIIDKMPMNGNHLALIHYLFPDSKIIFMVRHPIDVCHSCLMQDMLQVFSFNEASSVYNAYMQVIENYKSSLPLNMLDLKYESLIENMPHEIENVLKFIGLKWDPQINSYYQENSPVNTPSYQQVSQPIYQQAKYRYKNYLPFIKNDLQNLEKWIKYFNYTV